MRPCEREPCVVALHKYCVVNVHDWKTWTHGWSQYIVMDSRHCGLIACSMTRHATISNVANEKQSIFTIAHERKACFLLFNKIPEQLLLSLNVFPFCSPPYNLWTHIRWDWGWPFWAHYLRVHLLFYFWPILSFYPNVTTLRSGICYRICYRKSVCRLWRSWTLLRGLSFRQYFFTTVYLSHPLTSMQNFTEIVPGLGEPSVGAVKRKRGSKIERRWTCGRLS